jgi:hypothetical protein
MKRSERLSKSLNRMFIVYALAALIGALNAAKMEGHHEKQGVAPLIAGR